MNHSLIVTLIVAFCICGFCAGNGYAADKPTTPQPTAAEQDKQLSLEDARATVIINYLQGQIDQLKEYRIRIKDARQNLTKATPKAEKGKAPVKPVEQTSQGVSKGKQ